MFNIGKRSLFLSSSTFSIGNNNNNFPGGIKSENAGRDTIKCENCKSTTAELVQAIGAAQLCCSECGHS